MAGFADNYINALMAGAQDGNRARMVDMQAQRQNALLPLEVQQAQIGMQAQRQGMAIDAERLAMAREAGKREAAAFAQDAARRAQFEQEFRFMQQGARAYEAARSGNPQAFETWRRMAGPDGEAITLETFPAYMATAEGGMEVLKGLTAAREFSNPQPEKPASVVALEMRAAAAGLQPGTPQYQSFMAEGDAPKTIINNNQGGVSDKFYQTLDTKQAETFGVLIDEGMKIPSKMAQLDQLDQLLSTAPSGVEGALKMAAGGLGIPTEGLDDLQAADAIINSLVPAQRPVGSGTMSDRDVEMFRQSLPRIINQPGGNQKIMSALRGVMIYQQRQAEIANKVAKRQMTPAEGMDALSSLENPLAQFKRAGPVKIGNYTIEEVSE